MMKWTPIISALSLSALSFSAFSANDNDFQYEVTINYQDFSSSKLDIEPTWGVQYSYFGSPISQGKSPYQLNRFLAQTSVLDLNYSDTDGNDGYGIGGEYVFDSMWFIGGDYQYSDFGLFGDTDVYSINAGYYANDFTKVYVAVTKAESGNGAINLDSYNYNIGIKSFIETAYGEGVYFTADYIYTDQDIKTALGTTSTDYNGWGISLDYYFTKSFSIGGAYSDSTFEDAKDTYALNAAYFFRISDNISLSLSADKVIEPSSDGFSYDIGLVGRF